MGFSQGEFIRSLKIELKENYTKWNHNGETNFFTIKIIREEFLFLKSLLK